MAAAGVRLRHSLTHYQIQTKPVFRSQNPF
jgi:hypothetical protein